MEENSQIPSDINSRVVDLTKNPKKSYIGTYLIGSILLFLVFSGVSMFLAFQKVNRQPNTPIQNVAYKPQVAEATEETVSWDFNGNIWQANGQAPLCPDPLYLNTPVGLSRVESVLYPGQMRGSDYKAHGGFRLNGDNKIIVTAPLDATLISGSRYIEQGEIQYLLTFVNSCGFAFRFDHLLTLSPEIQKAVDTLPAPQVNDSRTTKFATPLEVNVGDTIATAVGFQKTNNSSFDFGVYDLRSQNVASQNITFAQKYEQNKEQAFYAVCWLNLLFPNDKTTLLNLPAGDSISGKTSDYCK